ncbi:MAG TPA: hypothetical protein VFO18_18015 [Methylomirabilota bacterium]|nr:hypothetical protein [Methylomirabilota bacterium]
MRIQRAFRVGVALVLMGTAPSAASDRLDSFRALVHRHLDMPAPADSEAGRRAIDEIYTLVDAEVLDNLRSGEPFASGAFLQERLEGFGAAWGGALFRVVRIDRSGAAGPLTLGLFSLSGISQSGSLRIYGRPGSSDGSSAALLGEVTDDGKPEVRLWPAGRASGPRFVASWATGGQGDGGGRLRIELWSVERDGPPRRLWSSAAQFPEGLWVSGWEVRSGEIMVRRELRYPGWKPGCPGQAEEELVYRNAGREGLVLLRRRPMNAWHRELGAAAAQLFAALAAHDRPDLRRLVPDSALRSRLPASLVAEPACDTMPAGPAGPVLVAATAEDGGRLVPWSLTWRRAAGGWRLTAAAPVLQ